MISEVQEFSSYEFEAVLILRLSLLVVIINQFKLHKFNGVIENWSHSQRSVNFSNFGHIVRSNDEQDWEVLGKEGQTTQASQWQLLEVTFDAKIEFDFT